MVTRNNTDHKMRPRCHGRVKVRDGSYWETQMSWASEGAGRQLLGDLVSKEGNWNRSHGHKTNCSLVRRHLGLHISVNSLL